MERPIPDLSKLRLEKSAYRDYPICPVTEKCVRINEKFLCQSYYWHYNPRPIGSTEDIFLRNTLVEKLRWIDQKIRLLGLRLLIREGFRPLSVQQFVEKVSVIDKLRKENPDITDCELLKLVPNFAASVGKNPKLCPPPHFTAGAVDLTLVRLDNGEEVMDKGHGSYKTAFPDALEGFNSKEFEQPKKFRRLLFWLAQEQNMVVNPTEWWHLSFGDQMWALVNKSPYAIYGAADDLL